MSGWIPYIVFWVVSALLGAGVAYLARWLAEKTMTDTPERIWVGGAPWISVAHRPPTEGDGDKMGDVLVIDRGGFVQTCHWENVISLGGRFTYWRSVPPPPTSQGSEGHGI